MLNQSSVSNGEFADSAVLDRRARQCMNCINFLIPYDGASSKGDCTEHGRETRANETCREGETGFEARSEAELDSMYMSFTDMCPTDSRLVSSKQPKPLKEQLHEAVCWLALILGVSIVSATVGRMLLERLCER